MAGLRGKSVVYAILGFAGSAAAYQLYRNRFHEGRGKRPQDSQDVNFSSDRQKLRNDIIPRWLLSKLNKAKVIDPTSRTCKAHLDILGYPSEENLHYKTDHILSYNHRLRNANWVFEVLTHERCYTKQANRKNSTFIPDELVPEVFRCTDEDFIHSGYDRGHLAAAGNHFNSQPAMDDTFLFTNICPQVGRNFNRSVWRNLERHVRRLTRKYNTVFVFTGPLYIPITKESGKKYVKYEVIGHNLVSVPTHFFKIVAYYEGRHVTVESYVMPNKCIEEGQPLHIFSWDFADIEKYSGLQFFTNFEKTMIVKADVVALYPAAKV